MSVAWILDSTYNTIKNTKLNQNLEVSSSLKAPIHYVEDLSISKNESGNMVFDAPIVEAVILQSDSLNTDSVFTSALNPLVDTTNITVNANLDFSNINQIQNLQALSTVNGFGTENQVLSVNGEGNLFWKNDEASDVSQWSTFPAVSDIEVGLNKVNFDTVNLQNDSGELSCSGVFTSNYLYSRGDFGAAGSFYNTGDLSQICRIDATNKDVLRINKLTNLVSTQTNANLEGFNEIQCESISTKNIIIPDSTPSSGQVIKYNGVGVEWADDTNTPSTWSQYAATQAVDMNSNNLDNVGTITMSGALNCNAINPLPGFTEVSITGDLNMVGHRLDADIAYFSGKVSVGSLFPTYIQQNSLYVSSNGSDTNNGSFEAPVKTIQRAIEYAESAYDNTYKYILVGPGVYAGFTVSKKCFIKGMAPSNPDSCSVGCQINSDIIVSIDSNDGDMFNNICSISNFLIAGAIIECNSGNTARSVLSITDCYLYQDSGSSGRMIHYNPSASDGRLWINNTKIVNQSTSGLNPVIEISVGMLKMAQCIVSGSGSQNILKLSGTSRLDSVVQCSFTSNTSSTTAPAIVELASSGAVFTFTQSAFIYGSNANKSGSVSSCGILTSSSTTQPTVILSYNSFFLAGTTSANYCLQDANNGTVRQCIILFFSNNSSLNNASSLRGTAGVSKFSLQNVA